MKILLIDNGTTLLNKLKELIPGDEIAHTFENFGGDATDFDLLPANAKKYLDFIENYLGVPISLISNAPDREKMIIKDTTLLV